jgi:hypothetical protein
MGVKEEWLGPESNQRHKDFQSSALPTELPSHKNFTEYLKSVAKLVGQKGKKKRFDNIIKKGHTT